MFFLFLPFPIGYSIPAAAGPGGGRPQRVPDKLIKYEEKTEMRETTGNPDQTGNLYIKVEF